MNIVLAHPGTQYSYGLARELYKQKRLLKFITTFCISDSSILNQLFGSRMKSRILSGVPENRFKSYPSLEIQSGLLRLLSRNTEDILYKRNLAFQQRVIDNDLNQAEVVIGFDTSSWKLAEYCKGKGIKFILDVSIGHPISKERIYSTLRTQFGNWKDISHSKPKKLIDLESAEFDLASKIVVPSSFVKRTLVENDVDADKIAINPFGTDLQYFSPAEQREKDGKIVFLFFGSLTARKGLPLLLAAWRKMDTQKAKLLIAGYGSIPPGEMIPGNVEVIGPVAASQRNLLFKLADVFVFPSYFEGLAQVQIEAAASGLPIIGTLNSGAEEVIVDGYNGFVIESGNIDQLIDAMEYFILNPDQILVMNKRLHEKINFFSWSSYGARWNEILNKL